MPAVIKEEKIDQGNTDGNKQHTDMDGFYTGYHDNKCKGQYCTQKYDESSTEERDVTFEQQAKYQKNEEKYDQNETDQKIPIDLSIIPIVGISPRNLEFTDIDEFLSTDEIVECFKIILNDISVLIV
jgi:hypothetical protein